MENYEQRYLTMKSITGITLVMVFTVCLLNLIIKETAYIKSL